MTALFEVRVATRACCVVCSPLQAIILVLEDGSEYSAEKMCTLLKYMASSAILTQDQITKVLNTSVIRFHYNSHKD